MGTTGQSITLANSIIGVGILAMPFCFQQCGIILATVILLFMGLVSRLCCYFLLKSALIARRRNFEFLAFHVFGPVGKLAVEIGIIGFLMGTCIAYFVVVGDLGPQIISKMFKINQSDLLRTSIMVIVSLVCVLPLGLLRNVDSLSNVSAATIGFYICLVLKVIAEACSGARSTPALALWRPAGLLQCVPIFSMALFCQTQLFEIFEWLPSLSLEKMNAVTKNAIHMCAGVYFTLGLAGYIAFAGQDISGNILMSLSPTMWSDVIKLGFVMSLACSFPLVIFPCRASLYSLLYNKVHTTHHDHIVHHSIPERSFRCITVAIVTVALVVSLLVPNIEVVLGMLGSTIGVLVCVVFPAACFVNITFKNTNERVLAKAVVVLGVGILVLGSCANLRAARDERPRDIDQIVEDFYRDQDLKAGIKPIEKLEQTVDGELKQPEDKNSVIQPPNPIPPESVEKKPEPVKKIEKDLIPDNKEKEVEEKNTDTHPRDVKTKLDEAKQANGNTNIKSNIQTPQQVKEKQSSPTIDDKNDLLKQQELIETIKQHGKEQKELIKEQKEILDELIKTKNEIKQNKIEADTNEAKKIAVESIKKIADMAILSLSGVASEKPEENNAVQEIAQKAEEAIEGIKEIESKSEKPIVNAVNKVNLVPVPNVAQVNPIMNSNLPQVNVANNQNGNKANILAASNIPNQPAPIAPNNIIQPNIQVNPSPVPQINNVNAPAVQNNNVPILSAANNVQVNNGQKVQPAQNLVASQNANSAPHLIPNPPINLDNVNNGKEHSHLLDEPQSYKQGEDTQKKTNEETNVANNNVIQGVPLPIAIINNANKNKVNNQNKENSNVNNNLAQNEGVQGNGVINENIPNIDSNVAAQRQKREVIDCTEVNSLKPEDKEICKALVKPQVKNLEADGIPSDFLPPVDLGKDLSLTNRLPFQEIHHIRSLKSYSKDDDDEKMR